MAILAEYDALPEVGHACGHNVIAASAIGAGVALAGVADQVGLTVSVIGTPAEEGGGGKIRLIEAGAFEGVHCALMIHPGPIRPARAGGACRASSSTSSTTARAPTPAAFPERGINAADALVIAQVAMGLLRQRLRPTDRVHGIVTRGGEAPNIIPAAHRRRSWMVRGANAARLDELREKVLRCFEAGALATGARLEVHSQPAYAEMRHDMQLAALYQRTPRRWAGRSGGTASSSSRNFSTDMGNVAWSSRRSTRSWASTRATRSTTSRSSPRRPSPPPPTRRSSTARIALAWTAIDAATRPELRDRLLAGTR